MQRDSDSYKLWKNWVFNNRVYNLGKQVDQWFYFKSRIMQHTPLIVYQMGKVASQSIYYSLRKVYLGVVVNTHSFSTNDKDWRVRTIYKHCVMNSRPLNIISLTREPIGRNISAFFQNFGRDTGVKYRNSNFSLQEIRELFLKNYNHDIPLTWFDTNIEPKFGIDVYKNPFPDAGINTYNYENFRLLVLRSENIDEIKHSAIEEFLGLTDFNIDQRNIGSNKEYAETYRKFLNTVKLPADYISKMCDSKYFNHFYSDEFIELTRKRWREKG